VVPASEGGLLVHDPTRVEPSVAFALSRLTFDTVGATPFGVFRSVERPVYDEAVADQITAAREQRGEGDLAALLHTGDTWEIT
jgi:2-oxoglutarate ferredoxin oxidoreductase subunit beta